VTWAAAGVLFGLGSLLRANLLFVAGAVLALLLFARWFAAQRRLASAAVFLGGLLVVLAPVLLRNRMVGNDWVFTTSQAGANWFIGNNPGNPDGTYAVPYFVRPSPDYEEIDFRREAERRSGRPLRPSEVSRFWVSEVLRWAVREPGRFLRLQGIKALAFLDRYEYPDNWSLYFVATFSPVLRLPLRAWPLLVAFGVLGAIRALRAPRDGDRAALAVLVVVYALSVVAFFVFSRYRHPIAFPLIILAASGVLSLWASIRARGLRGAGPGALVVAATLALSLGARHHDEALDRSQRFYNLAASLVREGRYAEGTEMARRALALDPKSALARLALAEIAEKRGDRDAQREYLARAYEFRPGDELVRVQMAYFNARTGGYASAAGLVTHWLAERESYALRQALVDIARRDRLLAEERRLLDDLLTRYPDDRWGRERLLELDVHEGRWGAVLDGAERLRRDEPDERRWAALLTFAYRAVGDDEAATRSAAAAGLPWPLPAGARLQDPLASPPERRGEER
jgi:tetratricopeptide (TPR) repeat protein